MDKKQFGEVMALTAAAYDKELSETMIRVYWEDLQDLPAEDFADGMRHLRRNTNWFPKVAEIIEVCLPAEPDLEQLATHEWDRVVMPQLSDSRSANSPNPRTERVIKDLGGWRSLGMCSVEELVWKQKEFTRRWASQEATEVAPIHRLGSRQGPVRIGKIVDGIA